MNKRLLGRVVSGVIIVSSLLICVVGYQTTAKQINAQKLEYAEITVKQEKEHLAALGETVSTFYLDNENQFLKPDLMEETIQDTSEALTNVKVNAEDFGLVNLDTDTTDLARKKEALLAEIEDIQKKYELQVQVSGLFTTAISDWTIVQPENPIKSTTTRSIIQQIKGNLTNYNNQWSQVLNSYLDVAEKQIESYEAASSTIASFLQGDQLSENGTVENYYVLVDQLKQIKNEELLLELKTQLEKVEQLMFPE